MGVHKVIDELNDVFRDQPVPQDEVLTVIGTAFARATSSGDREVIYFTADDQPALRLRYTRKGDITAKADAGLGDELASLIHTRVRALISAEDRVVWRQVWFSSLPLNGYWRYRDEWQIVSVPEDAPKPEFLMAENPFLIEVRGVSTGDSHVDDVRARRRLRELQLILSLVLRVSLLSNDRSPTHAWVNGGAGRPEYRQRGYVIPHPTAPANDFTPVAGLEPVPTVNDDDYFSPWKASSDFQVDVPALLPSLLDRYAAAAPADKETFLRACYWLSRRALAARVSMSLSYISVINSVEVLVPDATPDLCPECGRDRAPGPTARFRELVERYAEGVEGTRWLKATRVDGPKQLYELRSKLVHGGDLLDLDMPAAWGSLDPDEIEQSDQYGLARRVATAVIINWFFDRAASS